MMGQTLYRSPTIRVKGMARLPLLILADVRKWMKMTKEYKNDATSGSKRNIGLLNFRERVIMKN